MYNMLCVKSILRLNQYSSEFEKGWMNEWNFISIGCIFTAKDCSLPYGPIKMDAGLEIATDMVANATNIFSLATNNSGSVATLATRFLYDLDWN